MRRRLALTMAGLSGLVVISLGCVYAITESVIERNALEREMGREIQALMDLQGRGQMTAALSSVLNYFPGPLPPSLAGLRPGDFRQLHVDGRSVQVLAAADSAGHVHVLAHDLTLTQRREQWLLLSLLAGVAAAAGGAWVASGRLAQRILSPLTRLVEQIRRINPLRPAHHPVTLTGDPELDTIPDAINRLIEELDHVLQRERAFADAVSHELRTPLAVVRGALDVLRERRGAPDALVDRMDRATRRAEDDLVALLALSPAREPRPARRVDLREILPGAGESYLKPEAPGPRVTWRWDAETEAFVEPTAVAIIFTNLLRNSLRAAPHGHVEIQAGRRAIRVVDDGEGLPDDWPRNPEPRGRGLGLAIAQLLAERNGWRLEIQRATPRGTMAELLLERGAPGNGLPEARDPRGDEGGTSG